MTTIVIGTTPTIIYKFSIISPNDLIQAKMTIKGKNTILLSKFLSEATIGEDSISWKLSQAETLSLGVGTRTMMLNWLTADGTRGVSKETIVNATNNHIPEVMT